VTTQLARAPDGRVLSRWQTGAGASWFAYDHAGRIAWTLDADGTQTLHTWDPQSRTATRAMIRESEEERLTTTAVGSADSAGALLEHAVVGHGGEVQRTLFERDALGRVTEATAPDGVVTRYARDLAGIVSSVSRERGAGPVFETAWYSHRPTADGWATDITDPSGETTTATYNVWGEETGWVTPGARPEGETWAYDEHGRVVTHVNGGGEVVQTTYGLVPGVGETVTRRWVGAPTSGETLLGEWRYDDLGRPVQTTAVTRVPRDGGYELFNVDHDFTYDTNDRTTSQTLSFGGPPLVSSADWAIGPQGGWSRTLTYPDGTVVEEAVAAYGGFPLAIHGDLMFRANDSQRYGWGDLQRVRVSSKATPDMVRVAYEAPVPTGIGDLCHDGDTLWALAYAHDPGGSPEASIIGMAPETGELRATHDAFYRCPRGLPSAWACDGETGRAWLLCYAGGGQRGVLAEFEMGLGR